MATIKSFSDLQQSKKLAEILPLESADMVLWGEDFKYVYADIHAQEFMKELEDRKMNYVPCWSLAALLGVIPVTAEYKNVFIRLRIDKGLNDYAMWYDDLQTNLSTDIETEAKNFADACYKMILKLKEQNIL